MQSGNINSFNETETRRVGYAYYLFSLTFFISIIATLTLQSALYDLALFFGFIGLIIILISRKSLISNFKSDLLRGIGLYILFEIIISVALIIYILSVASSIITNYPNGVYPASVLSNMVLTGAYISAITLLFFYISYYYMNRAFYRGGRERKLIALLFLAFILTTIGFAGEFQIITLKLSSVSSLTSAESAIDLIKAHPLNIFTIPSVLSSLILLLLYYYSGRAIITNPSTFTDPQRY
jgi:hypothetical protein